MGRGLDMVRADASIDLLLADVGLPARGGRGLAGVARTYRPGLPVLLMTGYAETALDKQAFLGEDMDMLTRPFQIADLLEKVRQALG